MKGGKEKGCRCQHPTVSWPLLTILKLFLSAMLSSLWQTETSEAVSQNSFLCFCQVLVKLLAPILLPRILRLPVLSTLLCPIHLSAVLCKLCWLRPGWDFFITSVLRLFTASPLTLWHGVGMGTTEHLPLLKRRLFFYLQTYMLHGPGTVCTHGTRKEQML